MSIQQSESLATQFQRHWEVSTSDSNLTLHGFRRFKTTHLLNLRYLEAEIAEIDHLLYQLGLSLNSEPHPNDRLGLHHSQKDKDVPSINDTVTKNLILKLRALLKEYDEALLAFKSVMSMDTFSLLDDERLASLRTDLTFREKFKTRLVRVDQGSRARQDPFQRSIHLLLRSFRYRKMAKTAASDMEGKRATEANFRFSSQNTALLAEIISRVTAALITGIFLIIPLVILYREPQKSVQLAVVSTFIVIFACLVTIMFKASNLEMMVVSAAYAAILSVFVSNNPIS